jgi:hypothetical protein
MRARIRTTSMAIVTIALIFLAARAGGGPATLPAKASAGTSAEALCEKLLRRIPEVRFDSMPLEQAFDTLAERTKVNISVQWTHLAEEDVQRSTPVKLRLWDVTLDQALRILLSALDARRADQRFTGYRFGYTFSDNVVTVSTVREIGLMSPTEIYNVRDLIDAAVIGSSDSPPPNDPMGRVEAPMARSEAAQALSDAIMRTISPDSWQNAGGAVGSIQSFAGMLVIQQSAENQARVAAFLQKLRESDAKTPWPVRSTPHNEKAGSGH